MHCNNIPGGGEAGRGGMCCESCHSPRKREDCLRFKKKEKKRKKKTKGRDKEEKERTKKSKRKKEE